MNRSNAGYCVGLLFIILIVVYRSWISFDIFWAGDWPYYDSNTLKYFLNPTTWLNLSNLGFLNLTLWRLPIDFFHGIFGALGYSSNISEKLLVFWPTLIIVNIASFLLVRKITKSNLAGFVGAIVFNYNTYYFVINTAFLLYSSAAWSVLTIYIFINALERKKIHWFLLSGLTLFVAGSYDFRVAYINIFILILYFIYFSIFIEKFNKNTFFKNLSFSLTQGLIFGLLNIYWILTFTKAHSLTANAILQRGLFGNEFSNILYSFSLFHPFWTGGHTAYFNPQPVFFYFWLIPIFAILGLYLNRKNKHVLFFGIVALIGIFLTKQVGIPFSGVYPWLFENLPGFNAFREASKFYYIVVLGYSILIGAFISAFWKRWTYKTYNTYFKYLITFIVLFIFLLNSKPVLSGEIGDTYIPKGNVPNDYIVLNKYFKNNALSSKSLWIPYATNWSSATGNSPIINAAYIFNNDWLNIFPKNLLKIQNEGEFIVASLNNKEFKNLSILSSIRYLVIPSQNIQNGDDVFMFYGKSRKYYIEQIDNISWLKKINIGTKGLEVYENKNYRPHIYATSQKESIYKDLELMIYDVRSKFISGSEYRVYINNVKEPFYLNFSDSFHPQWKIRVGDFNWFNSITNKNYFINDKYHLQNDAVLNSFYINPDLICSKYQCVKNSNGTYDINMTLFFAPQSYLYSGLIVSGITLIIVLGYLTLVGGRYLYEKRN